MNLIELLMFRLEFSHMFSLIVIGVGGTSRDSALNIPTGYGLDSRGSVLGRGKRFFSSPQRPDRHLGPPILLSNGH
jgi:hypothetical protein